MYVDTNNITKMCISKVVAPPKVRDIKAKFSGDKLLSDIIFVLLSSNGYDFQRLRKFFIYDVYGKTVFIKIGGDVFLYCTVTIDDSNLRDHFSVDDLGIYMPFVIDYLCRGVLSRATRNFCLFAVEREMCKVLGFGNKYFPTSNCNVLWSTPKTPFVTATVAKTFSAADIQNGSDVSLKDSGSTLDVYYNNRHQYSYKYTCTPHSNPEELFYICEKTCGGPTTTRTETSAN
jgi:hypothetical protein